MRGGLHHCASYASATMQGRRAGSAAARPSSGHVLFSSYCRLAITIHVQGCNGADPVKPRTANGVMRRLRDKNATALSCAVKYTRPHHMDNLLARINGITVRLKTLRNALAAAKIKPKVGFDDESGVETVYFSIPVGLYQSRWLVRIFPAKHCLTISGGVTTTFFGHNVWVFNNEHVQLTTIIGIVSAALARIEGIELPGSLFAGSFESVAPERVELTNHFRLPFGVGHYVAIDALDDMLMLLYPRSHFRNGQTHEKPGVTGVGRTKKSRRCRIYDPNDKFADRPPHVAEQAWLDLHQCCLRQLRVEVIMHESEIRSAGLGTVSAWKDTSVIADWQKRKYRRLGLTFRAETNSGVLTPESILGAGRPSFVAPAQEWLGGAKASELFPAKSGARNRFRQFMEGHGYNINVPFAKHPLLAHGLHDVLRLENRAELPDCVRRDQSLFRHWWKQLRNPAV